MGASRGRVGAARWAGVVGALLLLAAARFQCTLGRPIVGTEDRLLIRTVRVSPAEVSLPAGGMAVLEGLAVDELGGQVEVQLVWTAADPTVATVGPPRAPRTVVTARRVGETAVTATHAPSGVADTARVIVIGDTLP